jgi:TatD DNase family protein
VLALAARHPEVRAALGFHPERLALSTEELEAVETQVRAHGAEVAALGEIGLPWYSLEGRGDAGEVAARGRERLARLLALARRLDRPVSLHAPHGAAGDALALLDRLDVGPAVFHWHKADHDVTRRIVRAGHFLGITPEVVYRERDQALVREAPMGALLLESDGPWPYGGPFGGRAGEPAMVARSAAAIAGLRGRPVDEMLASLADNARRVLRLA